MVLGRDSPSLPSQNVKSAHRSVVSQFERGPYKKRSECGVDWAISGGILLLLVAMVAVAAWSLWRFWSEWPQRRFKFAGQIVSRDRYPVSYWLGLGFG